MLRHANNTDAWETIEKSFGKQLGENEYVHCVLLNISFSSFGDLMCRALLILVRLFLDNFQIMRLRDYSVCNLLMTIANDVDSVNFSFLY